MKKAIAWQIDGGQPVRLDYASIDLEKHLEDWINADVSLIADDIVLIGRQVTTSHGTAIDLLAVDTSGYIVVIELKRDQTLRDTVAQGIEYAEWCSHLDSDGIRELGAMRYGSASEFEQRFLGQ